MRYLLLLFIAVPIIEIGVLIRVGGWLGLWPTLAIVILTAVLGTWMLRQQSAATMLQAQQRLQAGELPAQQIFEGLLLLIGGVLLLTPGFVTDAWGFACLVPLSRRWLASHLAKRFNGGLTFGVSSSGSHPFHAASGFSSQSNGQQQAQPGVRSDKPGRPNSGDVIEGDFREVD